MSREDEVKKALKEIRDRRNRGEEEPESSGGSPLPQIEAIFSQAKELSKRYGILLPPPFSPFDSFPRLPVARKDDAVERVERMPKVEEVKETKPEAPKPQPQINCPRCGVPSPVGTKFCPTCGWNLNHPYRMAESFKLRK